MPNRLEKTVLPTGGGGGGDGGGDGGGGGGGGGGDGGGGGGGGGDGLPPEGTPCFQAISDRIRELWPFYTLEYQPDADRFYVSTSGGPPSFYVTGSCSGGYVSLHYTRADEYAWHRSA